MTSEDHHVIVEIGKLLKGKFPDLTGYIRFDMCKVTEKVEGTVHYSNIKGKP